MSTDFFRNELYRTRHELYKSFSQIDKLISAEGRVLKELRATKHALWMARAKICELERLTTLHREWEWSEGSLEAFENAKRKCLQKAKEVE